MLKEIRLQELTPSPTSPRKTFDPVKLEELARSVGDVGVLEPILVRPARWVRLEAPGSAAIEGFEVVAGERRYRAATMAQVQTVPCIVRELTDVQVLEIQTIENLQRDDLHPLEEAAGFAALMRDAGYDVDRIAQRISKSAKYVYDRIKLLQLTPEAQKIFLDGEITAGHAILLARLSAADQERAIGGPVGGYQLTGLFEPERSHDVPGLELGDRRKRKAVSVRELETWINNNVRFRPDEVDLPNLFPETAAAIATAKEEELKVVKITHDYRVPDGARDEKERTFGRPSWKRADGQVDHELFNGKKPKASKTCEHSVLGVVVGGPARGEAFRVCVAKKKCRVHWLKEMEEAAARPSYGGASPADRRAQEQAQRDRWAEDERKRQEEQARWKKAAPKLLEALAEKLQTTPALDLVDLIIEACGDRGRGRVPETMQRGTTLEDAVRYCAFVLLSGSVMWEYRAPSDVPIEFKRVGIDAKKIVDQVAPKPKPEKKAKPKKATADEEPKGARARRRAKKGADVCSAEPVPS